MSSRSLSDLRIVGDITTTGRLPDRDSKVSAGQIGCAPIIGDSIRGRRVLVTGAGGSIGSELVTQIAATGPARLCLLDACEYNLYQIGHTLNRARPEFPWNARIGDIRDETSMRHLFLRERFDIVFHAAALKHVPLLEDDNVVEAVRTNVLGTKIAFDLCCAFGSDFVMISTDKAVNPSSRMGLTKRAAEIYVHDRAMRFPNIRASLVRFGNVLGSSGSVVPLFQKQIAAGGPVTITHPKMTRFLMTIDDAVRLTLMASSLPQSGFSLYVLDMGEPVRILDLAVEMIERAGFKPFKDIKIQFVGVRAGEKLHEELSYDWEVLQPTIAPGVRAATPRFHPEQKLQWMDALFAAADSRDEERAKQALTDLVPEYVGAKKGGGGQARYSRQFRVRAAMREMKAQLLLSGVAAD